MPNDTSSESPRRDFSNADLFGTGTSLSQRWRYRALKIGPWGCDTTKVILDDLKRNMSRGSSLSDELELSSVLGDTRAYLY